MKKFKFTIRGNKYDVEILNIEENIAEIEVNGTHYEIEIHKDVKQSKTPKLIRKKSVPSFDIDKAKTTKPGIVGSKEIKAPLPGTILEIKVKVGDIVKAGDDLLIMEAMKMENNIRADREGRIIAVKVNPGDSVLEGDALVEIGD